MSFESAKDKSVTLNGLGCLVKALIGRRIIIDLRDETSVAGNICEVDGFMNMLLENTLLENVDGDEFHYDTLYVKGRHIRFIHIPKELSIRETILSYLKKSAPKSNKSMTALQRFKLKKLQQYQEETKGNILAQKSENKV